MRSKLAAALVLLNFLFFITGCGYTTKAYFLPKHIKSIHIETFENKTGRPNIENDLRNKIIARFQDDGILRIASRETADVILGGEVTNYLRQALRYSNNEDVREYRLSITVDFELFDKIKNKVIVKETNFAGDTSFYLTGALAKSESDARVDALDDLAKRILNSVTTIW